MSDVPPRIDAVLLREVGPFAEVTIEFPPGTDPDLADVYLLTGPNGSGKSTVLYAIAALIACGQLGAGLADRRFRGVNSMTAVRVGDSTTVCGWPQTINDFPAIFGMAKPPFTFSRGTSHAEFYTSESGLRRLFKNAPSFDLTAPESVRPRFNWAAFAYAGMRSVDDGSIGAIREPSSSPFENCLSFVHTANAKLLAEWVAVQEFKRFKATEAGRLDRATALRESIHRIEEIITEITGTEFAFFSGEDSTNIQAQFGGAIVDLGLLPDGLKSIVSWIADLLMRLDRIPWENDVPPMLRSFLLLLDEVDVHLHPAWQRKVLPIVQRVFPNAQIIASTHSPFVVASAADAHVISLKVENGTATVDQVAPSQMGCSYSSVLRSIFGIETEFDIETETLFAAFHEAKRNCLSGGSVSLAQVEGIAADLALRSEEVEQLVALELRQLRRVLKPKPAVSGAA